MISNVTNDVLSVKGGLQCTLVARRLEDGRMLSAGYPADQALGGGPISEPISRYYEDTIGMFMMFIQSNVSVSNSKQSLCPSSSLNA